MGIRAKLAKRTNAGAVSVWQRWTQNNRGKTSGSGARRAPYHRVMTSNDFRPTPAVRTLAIAVAIVGTIVVAFSQSPVGGCTTPDPFVAFGGGTCVNGGWLFPGTVAIPPSPSPSTPVSSPTPATCVTPDPFVALGGGTCVNGGWFPGVTVVAPLPSPSPSPSSPVPSPPPATCATPDPFVALGGGTCLNGGWMPPGMTAVNPSPTPSPTVAPSAPLPAPGNPSTCGTPDPFVAFGGGTCVNGGWLAPGMPLPPSAIPIAVHLSGIVESTNGVPLAGVIVSDVTSGVSTMTDVLGRYTLSEFVPNPSPSRFVILQVQFSKTGYEPPDSPDGFSGYVFVDLDHPDTTVGTTLLQPIIRINAGTNFDSSIVDDNAIHMEPCWPCQIIRVESQSPGVLVVRLTWSDARSPLTLWKFPDAMFTPSQANPSEVVAAFPIEAGETRLFIGLCNFFDLGGCRTEINDESFHLVTEFTPSGPVMNTAVHESGRADASAERRQDAAQVLGAANRPQHQKAFALGFDGVRPLSLTGGRIERLREALTEWSWSQSGTKFALAEKVVTAGYSYSTLREPVGDDVAAGEVIEMLRDWGWTGSSTALPWLDAS